MDRIRIRFALDLEVIAKQGWRFDYDEGGELRLISKQGDQTARREDIIREMVTVLEQQTIINDELAWHVAATDAEIDGELP